MGFDNKVHIRDPKTGRIVRENHYVLHITKSGNYYERDGVQYYEDGSIRKDRAVSVPKPEKEVKPLEVKNHIEPEAPKEEAPVNVAAPEAKDPEEIEAEKLGLPSMEKLQASATTKQITRGKNK